MRFAALFALMFLLPLFACLPAGTAYAEELININTADAALLDTLPGIGPSKAVAIIDYRTQNGPFTSIEGIQNVSGIGNGVTYANIAPLITVGNTSAPSTTGSTNSTSTIPTATTTATVSSSGGAPPEYIPIPTLRIITVGDRTVSAGADTAFTAVVYDGKGNRRDDAFILWSFGDGMQRTGASVYHAYYYPGEYIAVARVSTSDGGDASKEMVITAEEASIKIVSVSARGVSISNDSQRTLDLSLWRLSAGGKEFRVPAGTQILSGRTILFPSQIIQLPIAGSASLLYPSGETAATYPTTSFAQPQALQSSFNTMQTAVPLAVSEVEPIISTNTVIQAYDEEVRAPAPATELAAVGAALPAAPKKQGGVFRSPWFLGLLGVVALAGTAFIFL